MLPDKHRKPGFYWVRFEGVPLVAEYVTTVCKTVFVRGPHGHNAFKPHWHVPGSGVCFEDQEVCELLTSQLRMGVPSGYPLRPGTDKARLERKHAKGKNQH